MILFGWCGVMLSNTVLSLNFLMTIKYNWSNADLKKKLERPYHALLILFCVLVPIPPLVWDLYNPTITYCFVQSYPFSCHDESECERGNPSALKRMNLLIYGGPLPLAFMIITTSMVMLYRSVKRHEINARQYASDPTIQRLSLYSRKVFLRAVWYVLSFSAVWLPGLLIVTADYSVYVQFVAKILLPSQGLGNAFVYTHFKALKVIGSRISYASGQFRNSVLRIRSLLNSDYTEQQAHSYSNENYESERSTSLTQPPTQALSTVNIESERSTSLTQPPTQALS